MTTVVVSGAIANKPRNGGEAWVRLSWILGLRRLGCDVYFVEQIDPASCFDAEGRLAPFEQCVNLSYYEDVVVQFGLEGSAALVYGGGEKTSGLGFEQLQEVAETADLLVNISGHLDVEPLMRRFRRKAYVDLDPGFTQLWQESGNLGARLAGHDVYFTVGENIGAPGSDVPTAGISWHPVRPPVVLDEWPVADTEGDLRFTTVATWRGPYGPIEYGGKRFGLKVHEFRKVIDLPTRVAATFEMALDIHPGDAKDLEALRSNGWRIVDPKVAVPDPDSFRRYVQASGAEFSVAQGMYVETGLGWFSDRTVRYLASGKPALVQETGFTRNYPVGDGLLAFTTVDEAAREAERIVSDYEAHARAARALAQEYFDSDRVLGRFLEAAGAARGRLPR